LAIEGTEGATDMLCKTAEETTPSAADPLIVPEEARMVEVPTERPEAKPVELTVATTVLDDVQLTTFVIFDFTPPVKVPVAVNCCWVPLLIEALPGVIAIAVSPVRAPVPESVTDWGLLAAVSVMISFPVRVPTAMGVKVTEIVQLELAASFCGVMGQLLVCAKSPVTETEAMVSGTDWRFFSVTSLAPLVVFTIWLEKESEVADKPTGGGPASLLVLIKAMRKIAAKGSANALRRADFEMRCK
jgi:hypothetical protein